MSSVCPNCGSGMIEDDTLEPFCPLATLSPWACQRIGSLREELAAARDAYNYASDTGVRDRIALRRAETRAANLRAERDEMKRIAAKSERDAERDQIADWIEAQGGIMSEIPDNGQCKHGQWSWTGCEMCGLEETAKAIRNNEHRSNG